MSSIISSDEYPEGGLTAWLSVLGSLCGMMCCFGFMNILGTFQTYISGHQLKSYSEAEIGWIFGLYLFMAYVSGILTGPIFDAIGSRLLMASGSVLLLLCVFLLAVCTSMCSVTLLAWTCSCRVLMVAIKSITTLFLYFLWLVALEPH